MLTLNRATEKLSSARIEIAKVDLQIECLHDYVKQKDEEALALENEIAILQAKRNGIRELQAKAQGELDQLTTKLVQLHKEAETKEKEGTGRIAG